MQTIGQEKRQVMEYICEFWRIAGKLKHWLEQLLVYHFRDGLNQELFHTCLPQGISNWIRDWYRLATVVELNIKEYKRHGRVKSGQKRVRSDGKEPTTCINTSPLEAPRHKSSLCFRCGQEGHRAAVAVVKSELVYNWFAGHACVPCAKCARCMCMRKAHKM